MKLILSILSAAVLCSTQGTAEAQDNFSLWPRRPEELEQARQLLQQKKWDESAYLLKPFIKDSGVTGIEAREMVSRVNKVHYLSRMNPYSTIYVVRAGDTLPRIAAQTKCPVDVLMLYNGIVSPSSLKVGQNLVYIDMALRLLVDPSLRELSVWDGDILVASYKILSFVGHNATVGSQEDIHVTSRESYIHGKRIPRNAVQSVVADKKLRLSNGFVITGKTSEGEKSICLTQADVNEIALLIREKNSVCWHIVSHENREIEQKATNYSLKK